MQTNGDSAGTGLRYIGQSRDAENCFGSRCSLRFARAANAHRAQIGWNSAHQGSSGSNPMPPELVRWPSLKELKSAMRAQVRLAIDEMTFLGEVVVEGGVNRGELPKALHLPDTEHR